MEQFLPFFVILFAALFFSEFLRRLYFPWVVALIIGGIIIGPFGFDLVFVDSSINFLSQIGLIFLMFMAGLEMKLSRLLEVRKLITFTALINGLIPFAVGIGISFYFGLNTIQSLLIGIIFISSSVAVIIPMLERTHLFEKRLGSVIIGNAIVLDIVSLLMLSILFQNVVPTAKLPLPIFYLFLAAVISLFYWLGPKLQKILSLFHSKEEESLQEEFHAVLTILFGTVILFSLLGLHPIVAGFFAGLILSKSVGSEALLSKFRLIGYGLFIPVFFVVVGMKTDFSVFEKTEGAIPLISAIVLGYILAKYISGWIGAKTAGFYGKDAQLFAVSTTPQLSVALAATFTGLSLGMLSPTVVTAMVMLSIATTFVGPFLLELIVGKNKAKEELITEEPFDI